MMALNGVYPVHTWIESIDAYDFPDDLIDWSDCPCCGLKPQVWEFDNGRSTACGCWENKYDHFSIWAESIMSVHIRTNKTADYYSGDLLKNWNHWCAMGEVLFEHASKRTDGRW